MDSDISTDPSDYSDYSDSDYESTLSTENISHIHSDNNVNDKSSHTSFDDTNNNNNQCNYNNKSNINNNNNPFNVSIDTINKSIDAVLSSLSIPNIQPLKIENIQSLKTENSASFKIENNIQPLSNKHNTKKMKFDIESSDEWSDDDSSYSYSSEPSYSDDQNDDYFPKDIKIESIDNNNNNNNNKPLIKPKKQKIKKKIIKKESCININNNGIQCEICCDIFEYHTLYRKHMNKIHKILKPYTCPRCPRNDKKRYQSKGSLDTHIEKHHDCIRNYECNICHKLFYEKYAWKQHEKIHENEQHIPCELCKDIFTEHTKYRKHMNERHDIERAYVCDKCPNDAQKRYASQAGLYLHIRRDHEGMDRTFKCQLCTKAFYDKTNLKRHQRVHDGLKPFKCTQCKLRFTQKCTLKQHVIAVHLKQRNWPCTYCEKKFACSTTMKVHIVSQHDDKKYSRFECRTCYKRFYEKGTYYKHIDNAHRPKDPKKEMIKKGECYYPGCNKKYTGKNCGECLKYHLVATHRDREYARYECKKCDKLYYDKTRHREHMMTHRRRKKVKK